MVLLPNDEDVANSSKKRTQFKTRVHKPYPISDKMVDSDQNLNSRKSLYKTYIAYIRDYPPPPANRGEKRVADYESRLRKLTPVLFLALSLRYNILSDVN